MFAALIQKIKSFFTSDSSTPVGTPPTVVRRHTLNYFEPDVNSNKVWIGIAYSDGLFEARFGRVRDGANLTSKTKQFNTAQEAERELERKRAEKLRKGYRDTAVVGNATDQSPLNLQPKKEELSKIAANQIGGASEDSVTAELVKYLAEVNIHHITQTSSIKYNASNATFTTPLGVLAPEAISHARDIINEVKVFNASGEYEEKGRAKLVREYYQLVPKDFGTKIPKPAALLQSDVQIDVEVALLEALESILDGDPRERKLFDCQLIKVPHYTDEGRETFRTINGLFRKTRNFTHHPNTAKFKMVRLYEVGIAEMKRNFLMKSQEIGNVRSDLWHGTRASNLLSILKNGLVIPPSNAAHCTGRMFGNGIYTSLQSTKALNYATDFWNRSGGSGQRVFMFLCEAALGKVHKPKSLTGKTFPARGTDSTWVEPNSSGVLNHECIVYEPSQLNLVYLAEFGS